MKTGVIRGALTGVVMALAGIASTAHAAVIVQNLTLSNTPTSLATFGTPGFTQQERSWLLTGFVPFNLAAGDQLQVNVTFSSAVSVVDNFGSPILGGNEGFIFGFNNNVLNPGFANAAGTNALNVTSASGSFLGNPVPGFQPGGGSNPIEGITGFGVGNLTNSSMFVSSFTYTFDVASIPAQSAPFFQGVMFLIDGSYPVVATAAPAPSALALLGLGLFGIGALRRKLTA